VSIDNEFKHEFAAEPVEKCPICGPIKGKNYLIPYEFINARNVTKGKLDIARGYYNKHMSDIYKKPFPIVICKRCVTVLEMRMVQDEEIENFPLLINLKFYSDEAKKYIKRVLQYGKKDSDEELFKAFL
jgi:hypothetical protein